MNVTGQITSIQPTQRGGYQSQHGYIYTFDMTINGPSGPIAGEVGSKSQQYPKNVGETVNVVVQSGQYGNRFKVIQPQQGTQQPQQQPPMPTQPQSNVHQADKRDWDKIAEGKVLCNVVCSAIQAGMIQVTTAPDAQKWTDFIMGKDSSQQQQQPPMEATYEPPPQDTTDYGRDGSEIPF
jgi:hypothetical protein